MTDRGSEASRHGMVLIGVGSVPRTHHYVHKALIVYHSDYFRKALQGSSKEARNGVIPLRDMCPVACTWTNMLLCDCCIGSLMYALH
jgi:hypothetical protein